MSAFIPPSASGSGFNAREPSGSTSSARVRFLAFASPVGTLAVRVRLGARAEQVTRDAPASLLPKATGKSLLAPSFDAASMVSATARANALNRSGLV